MLVDYLTRNRMTYADDSLERRSHRPIVEPLLPRIYFGFARHSLQLFRIGFLAHHCEDG